LRVNVICVEWCDEYIGINVSVLGCADFLNQRCMLLSLKKDAMR